MNNAEILMQEIATGVHGASIVINAIGIYYNVRIGKYRWAFFHVVCGAAHVIATYNHAQRVRRKR